MKRKGVPTFFSLRWSAQFLSVQKTERSDAVEYNDAVNLLAKIQTTRFAGADHAAGFRASQCCVISWLLLARGRGKWGQQAARGKKSR